MSDISGVLSPASAGAAPHPGYRIENKLQPDSDIEDRDRVARWAMLLSTTAVAAIGPIVMGAHWGSLAGPLWLKTGVIVGIGVAALAEAFLLPRVLVSNPEVSAYVTLDAFDGHTVVYGPGLHPAFPWEERNTDGNYSLQVVTKPFSVWVQTNTAQVQARGIFEYQIDLSNLRNFIGIDETTVDIGFDAFIESFLTRKLADKTFEEARIGINDLNQELADEFMGIMNEQGTTMVEFESAHGIRTVAIAIRGMHSSDDVQAARDAVDEGAAIFKIVASSNGLTPEELKEQLASGKISTADFKEYRREALAMSKNATLDLRRVDGSMPAAIAGALVGGNNGNRS
jgi:hypothetical protein